MQNLASIFNESTSNNIFIESVDFYIYQSLRKYWSTNPRADMTDIMFKEQLLLAIQIWAAKSTNTKNQAAFHETYWKCSRNNLPAYEIEIKSSTSLTRLSENRSKSPPVLPINTSSTSHTKLNTLSSSSTLPSLTTSTWEVCYNQSLSSLTCPVLQRERLATLTAIREDNTIEIDDWYQHLRPPRPGLRFAINRRFHNNRQQVSSSSRHTRVLQLAKNTPPSAKK